jgi:hypothetical protein
VELNYSVKTKLNVVVDIGANGDRINSTKKGTG